VLAKVEAVKGGYEEAILLDHNGKLSEGTGENLFVIKDGKVFTPPLACDVLEGFTRDTIFAIARDEGIPMEEKVMVRSELYNADEIFLSGTAAEVVPIRDIDDRFIGEPGPITRKIQDIFYSIIKGENDKYADYLEWV
jgi:branched-chain amino acid aminotransferase